MNRVFVASLILVVKCCLTEAQPADESTNQSELDVIFSPLYSQLETLKRQVDAVRVCVKAQCNAFGGCSQDGPLGMKDGRIPDDHITASSYWRNDANHAPARARLDFNGGPAEAWAGDENDPNLWIQVDFDRNVYVTGVITQGRGDFDQWVTEYQVQYSEDGQNWKYVINAEGTPTSFVGNNDRSTQMTTRFATALYTRFLRILPTEFFGHPSMRFEVLGCY